MAKNASRCCSRSVFFVCVGASRKERRKKMYRVRISRLNVNFNELGDTSRRTWSGERVIINLAFSSKIQ